MKSSDLLFNVLSLFDFRIKIFSSKHRSHDLPPAVYAGTRLIIDHLMLNDLPFSLKFQAYFDSSVLSRTLRSSKIFCGCYTAL